MAPNEELKIISKTSESSVHSLEEHILRVTRMVEKQKRLYKTWVIGGGHTQNLSK